LQVNQWLACVTGILPVPVGPATLQFATPPAGPTKSRYLRQHRSLVRFNDQQDSNVPRRSLVPLRRIMVIRHGEKPSLDGSVLGVDVAGSPNPDELSVRGWQRAGALVRFFAPADGPQRPGIQSPEFLFATGLSQHVTSVRAAHTLAPLADFLASLFRPDSQRARRSSSPRQSAPCPAWYWWPWSTKAFVPSPTSYLEATTEPHNFGPTTASTSYGSSKAMRKAGNSSGSTVAARR